LCNLRDAIGILGSLFVRVGRSELAIGVALVVEAPLRLRLALHVLLAIAAQPRKRHREQPLLGFVDTGVTASEYSSFQVPDPSFVPGNLQGAPSVTVFNRPAGAYGRDRYLLTNRTGDSATSWALEAGPAASTRPCSGIVIRTPYVN
jgi:hypothetical protein